MSEYSPELGPYNTQVQQANNHTEKLVQTIGMFALGLGSTRAVVNGAAADFQHYTAGMAAAASVTGQSYAKLSASSRQLARDLPIGQKAAADMISTVQQVGLTAKGQEGQIASLAKTMTQLTAATGSMGPGMAAGFLQLNRQMASLDPNRVRRFADELTRASTIAPASNIVDMSRQIAPAAQASGMGMGAVMGLSTAFAKQGDDSFVAVNAVNKMLTDLNRSVHEGTPDMARYAAAIGMTAQEFKNMYQNNPTDAVNALVNAVGRAGPQSMRILDELGIGSPRAQRAFLNVAQSGGLQPIMQQVMGGYGSGQTASASKVAFNNVQDSMVRLGNAASEVAQTFERPLLNATNNIVKLAGTATRGIGNVIGSGPVGAVTNVAMQAALPLMAARFGIRALNMGTLAAVAGRSTFVRGAMAGAYSSRRGGVGELSVDPLTGRLLEGPHSRDARDILERAYHGSPLAENEMAASRIGRGMDVGSFLGSLFPQGGGGPSLFQRARGLGMMGLGFVARGQAEMYRIARTSPTERDAMRVRGFTAPHEQFATHLVDLREQIGKGAISHADAMRSAMKEFDSLTATAGKATPALKELGVMVKTLGVEATVTGASGMKGLAGGLGKGVLGLAGGPVGLTMMAGFAGYEMWQHNKAENRARDQHIDSLFNPNDSTQNRYNDAIGLAAQNTQTFADAVARSSNKINQAVTTVAQAATVTGRDRAAAGSQPRVQDYHGSVAQVTAAVEATFPTKPSPAQLDRVKQDLVASGYSDSDIHTIITAAGGAGSAGATAANVATLAGQAGADSSKYHPGYGTRLKHWASHPWQYRPGVGPGSGAPIWGGGSGGDAKKDIDKAAQDITSQFNQIANDPSKGQTAAMQYLFRAVNQVMAQLAQAPDDGSAFGYGSQVFSRLLTGLGNKKQAHTHSMSRADYQQAGGSFTDQLDKKGVKYGQYTMSKWSKLGASPTGPNAPGTPVDASVIAQANAAAPGLAGLLGGSRAAGITPAMIREFQTGQSQGFNNTGLTTVTAQQLVAAATRSGTSPGSLAAQATALGARNQDLEPLTGQVTALAQQQFQRSLSGMSQPEQWQAQIQNAEQALARLMPLQQQLAKAGLPADETLNSEIANYTSQLDSIQQSEKQSYQARIMAQYDFQKNYARSQEQFGITVSRFNRDYQIQLTRQREDSAKSLYDPYTRIAAKPVYDAGNLLMNTREQLQAMRQQVSNLRQLRKMGLSEATIRMLGLYDPNNAQQTQQLVNDMQSDHSLVAQFNQNAAQRQQVGFQLVSQDPAFKRAKEDHARQLRDMRSDQARQLAYMVQDNKEQDLALTTDMTTLTSDMNKIIHGQHVDLSNQLHGVWDTTLNQATATSSRLKKIFNGIVPKDLISALNLVDSAGSGGGSGGNDVGSGTGITATGGQSGGGFGNVAVGGSASGGMPLDTPGMHRTAGTSGSAGTYYVDPGTGSIYKGAVTADAYHPSTHNYRPSDAFISKHKADPSFNQSIAKSMKPAWAKGQVWRDWLTLWNNESGWNQYADNSQSDAYGIAQALPANKYGSAGADWRTNPATQIKWGIQYIAGRYGDPSKALHAWLSRSPHWYATGGIATSPQAGIFGEVPGVPEALIPLDARGASVLAGAMKTYLGDDVAGLRGGGLRHAIYITDSSVHHHDARRIFQIEHMEVAADDPATFATKSEAKARRDNLTATRGVSWSRT